MKKNDKKIFRCTKCNHEVSKWQGKCPECECYDTFEEVENNEVAQNNFKININNANPNLKPIKVKDVKFSKEERLITSFEEFNRVLGGGIVTDSIFTIVAEPGMGKTTLMGIIANDLGLKGYTVLYISGEESENQVKSRIDRIVKEISDNFYMKSENNLENILGYIANIKPDLVIVDSIHTIYTSSLPTNKIGGTVQLMTCAEALTTIAKRNKIAIGLVSHITKDGELAGPKDFEHLIDCVLELDGEKTGPLRELVSPKNRFGGTDEIGLFLMSDIGLTEIKNPNDFFTTKRKNRVVGSALTVLLEGTRPIIIEIESLITTSFNNIQTVTSENINKEQIKIISAILDQRTELQMYDKNIYIKVTGGLKIKEQVSLGLAASLISSSLKIELENNIVFIGDIGLTGELKGVQFIDKRIKETSRLGFKKVFIPNCDTKENNEIEIVKINSIQELVNEIKKMKEKK